MKMPEVGADVVPTPAGRRERNRQQVRDRLYDAALHLFVTQGYEATTMDQIAEAADVARATVFNHFSQKDKFLEQWGVRRRARVREILGSRRAQDLPVGDRLHCYLKEMVDINLASRAETAVLMDASARYGRLLQDPALEIELARIIEQGQQHGEISADIDCSQAGQMLAACYFTTILRWIREEPAPFDLHQRIAGALDIILLGILPDEVCQSNGSGP